ncbi:MAG: DUF5665 domain-containing protein [Syntrophomonadaceae bacterium]
MHQYPQDPRRHDELNHMEKTVKKLDEIALAMEKLGIAEYVEMLNNPRRLLRINFWAGVARGFGMAIGFTLLGALVLYALQKMVVLNASGIGRFIAEIVNIVQNQLHAGGGFFQNPPGSP